MSKQAATLAPAFKALVDAERRATWVYYRPRPAVLRQLAALLAIESHVP